MNNTQLLDYTGAITLATGIALGLVTLIESMRPLSTTLHNAILRVTAFVLTLAGVIYLNWAAGSLDLQHQALVYVTIAAGYPALHVVYKINPNKSSSDQPAPVAAPDALALATEAVAAAQAVSNTPAA